MVEIDRIGHSSIKIGTEDKTAYIDPYYSDSMPDEVKESYEKGEKADVLLITHDHHDHCDPSTFQHILDEDTKIVAPEICSDKIESDFITVDPGDSVELDDIDVRAVHAYNRKRKRDSGEPFHPKGEGVGYLITAEGKTIYHPGDTENIPEMVHLDGIHTAFLPIDGTYTMDIEEAIEAAKVIEPDVAVPFHERDADPKEFKDRLEKQTDIKVEVR